MNTADDLPRVALIAGPTASGKSALALDLAARENGTIINADASQVYRGLRILSARPSAEDEARAPHRLYGHRDGADACTAAAWAAEAKAAIAEVHAAGGLPILVGGTGLYLRVLLDGIAPVPPIDDDVRRAVRLLDTADAHAALMREDAAIGARLHPHDASRVRRALEVVRSTGRSMLAWRDARAGGIRGQIAIAAILTDPPIATLYAQCDLRCTRMIAAGALDEVAALLARRLDPALPVMRAIGVRALADHLAGRQSLDAAIGAMRQATRNYAKRQRTWFRHQPL